MKNLIFLVIGLATALPFLNGQQNLNLDDINSIGLSINAVVTISEGSSQKISVDGPSDLINELNTTVKNGSWNIKFEDRSYRGNSDQLTFDIQVKSLKSLAVSGQGTINTKGRFSKVDRRNIAISGTGSITFEGDSDEIDIALSGVGHMEINCNADRMHAALSGSGDIILEGSTDFLNMAASGSGTMGSRKLKSKKCKAAISGSTVLTAEVTDDLDIVVSGSGVFKYLGNPTIKKRAKSKSSVQKI